MKKIVAFFLLALLSFSAFADAPVKTYRWTPGGLRDADNSNTLFSQDGPDACRKSTLAFYPNARDFGGYTDNGYYYMCTWKKTFQDDNYGNTNGTTVAYDMRCVHPAGSRPDTTKPLAQQCSTPPPTCPAGQKWVVKVIVTPTNAGNYPKNFQGCAVTLVQQLRCYTVGDKNYCMYEMAYTGAPAGPETTDSKPPSDTAPDTGDRIPSPPAPPPDDGGGKCPKGTVQMGFSASGKPLCVGMGTDPDNPKPPGPTTTKPPVTTTEQNGDTKTVDEVTRTNKDGSTTTTTTTTTVKPDGTKTISQTQNTSTKADGGLGTSDAAKENKNFCEQNPTLSVCRNSSVSGQCAGLVAAVECNGDAIECATMNAVATQVCIEAANRKEVEESGQKALGERAMGGDDPSKGDFPSAANGQVVSASNLDQSGFLGGRSCFADKVVTVMGKSITLPFSKTCDALLALRFVMMIIATMVSFRLLSGAILH